MLWVVMAPKVSWLLTYLSQKQGKGKEKRSHSVFPKRCLQSFWMMFWPSILTGGGGGCVS